MLSKRLNKYVFVGLGAITALSLMISSRPIASLQISSTDFQCVLTEQSFTLQWIHSVEKELWQEHYQTANQQLLLTTSHFKTFGAGTPSNEGTITSKDGWLHYQVDRLLPRINWIISRNVESTILTKLGVWPIFKDFNDYAEIQIQVMQVPRWHYFTQESCDDYFERP